MTLCRSRGEAGRARHGGEQVQCGVWCSARCLPSSQGFAPKTEVCRRLPGLGPLPRSGGFSSRSLARVDNAGLGEVQR